jgi:hypothetical protein
VYAAERLFRRIVKKASKHHVPAGRIPVVKPGFPNEAVRQTTERDRLRTADPSDPRVAELTAEIRRLTAAHQRKTWLDKLASFDRKTNVGTLWKTIKTIANGPSASPNQAIAFGGAPLTHVRSMANEFNKQFTSVVVHKSSKTVRQVTKSSKARRLADAPSFTDAQLLLAIRTSKASKAAGPDGLTMIHLKHLGPIGRAFLVHIYNPPLALGRIPEFCKMSTFVPLLTAVKNQHDSKSYRPVSLLSPCIKVLERLILPILNEHLVDHPNQHGFRPLRSTVTALLEVNSRIAAGFNQEKPPSRTVLLQIDLSKAFDMVNHELLLRDLNQSSLPGAVIRWLSCYLHGRQSRVLFRNCMSKARNVHTGVPQGAVTSPKLFNFYISRLPQPPEGVGLVLYADDLSALASGRSLQRLCDSLNAYTPDLIRYLKERQLPVSGEKCTVSAFTPDSAQANYHPPVYMNGVQVPLERQPKLLGVLHDTFFSFAPHCRVQAKKVRKRNNILKCLAGASWGQDCETMLMSYKAFCRPVLDYGAPIWAPVISGSSWSKLQVAQNEALRIATGCHGMTSIDHLHQESKVLDVRRHAELLADQYLLSCHRLIHPCHHLSVEPDPPRAMKKTIWSNRGEIAHLVNGAFDDQMYRNGLRTLHTEAVERAKTALAPNRVLGGPAPPVAASEKTLPRRARTTLAQLRSGFCRLLNSYQHRITRGATPDICPSCRGTPHDVAHLFNCAARPTTLTPTDLWSNPRDVARFLGLSPPDDDDQDDN